ncbi:MAG TPA: hypothetical protein VNT26_07200, partial [Candidatus Sulfotelmatobacter sp.]|nr:hypothetical protein [Candidatus Sulfotelmatobacter sp.]
VRATLQDLDTIETATQVLNIAPPQINLKATFLELPDEKVAEFWKSLEMNCPTGSNAVTILTAAQARKVQQDVRAQGNATLLNEPSITTLSGRQTQIQVVDMMTVVTGINPQALKAPGIASKAAGSNGLYQTTSLPVGPTLDLVSYVGADGYTVRLTSVATLTEFLGYDEPTNSPTVYINGKKERAVLPLPQFRVRAMTNSAVLWDGQTVVLCGAVSETVSVLKDKVAVLGDLPLVGKLFQSESRSSKKKQMMVLITSTIIDPAGNRVHEEEEMKRVSGKGKADVQH